MNLPVWFLLCKYNALVLFIYFLHFTFIFNLLFYIIYRILSWNSIGTTRLSTVQNGTVCVSTSSVQYYSRVVIIAPPLLPWLLKNFFIPPCSRYRLTIFSGQSVISRVYTSRFGNGTVRLEPGTRYCTQWITPQEWAVLNRTVPYHAVEKCHKLAQSDRSNSIWLNDMAQLIGFLLYQ